MSQEPLAALRRKHPWPAQRPDFEPVHWELDGGGRHIVVELIREHRIDLLLEIGAFLGGSAKAWLDASPDLRVIAVDPWGGKWWGDYARRHGRPELGAQLDRPDGPFQTFLASMWDYRERLIPVRRHSPEVLFELHAEGLRPGLIYIDADKKKSELETCLDLFPDAWLTGDDWNWGDWKVGYPMRKLVRSVASQRGLHIITARATWVMDRNPPSLADRTRGFVDFFRDAARDARKAISGPR